MALHFTAAELAERVARTTSGLRALGMGETRGRLNGMAIACYAAM